MHYARIQSHKRFYYNIITTAERIHSGIFGGSAPNAIHAASRIVASMYKDDGSIAIEGFQDGLIRPTQDLREEIKAVEPDLAATLYKEKLGIARWIGDPN